MATNSLAAGKLLGTPQHVVWDELVVLEVTQFGECDDFNKFACDLLALVKQLKEGQTASFCLLKTKAMARHCLCPLKKIKEFA